MGTAKNVMKGVFPDPFDSVNTEVDKQIKQQKKSMAKSRNSGGTMIGEPVASETSSDGVQRSGVKPVTNNKVKLASAWEEAKHLHSVGLIGDEAMSKIAAMRQAILETKDTLIEKQAEAEHALLSAGEEAGQEVFDKVAAVRGLDDIVRTIQRGGHKAWRTLTGKNKVRVGGQSFNIDNDQEFVTALKAWRDMGTKVKDDVTQRYAFRQTQNDIADQYGDVIRQQMERRGMPTEQARAEARRRMVENEMNLDGNPMGWLMNRDEVAKRMRADVGEWKDSGGHLQRAALVLGVPAAAVGGSVIDDAMERKKEKDRVQALYNAYPELNQHDPAKISGYYDMVRTMAPRIARNPVAAGAIVQNLADMGAGGDLQLLSNLSETDSKFRASRAQGPIQQAITQMPAILGLEMPRGSSPGGSPKAG